MANIWDHAPYMVDYDNDDVDDLGSKYPNLVTAVFGLLNKVKAWCYGEMEPVDMSPWLVWADTANLLLKIRNANNTAWITLGKLTDKFGMTPAYIGAVKDSGVSEILVGTEGARPAASTAGRWYLATNTCRLFRDNGTTWDLILSLNWADIKSRPTITLGGDVAGSIDLNQSGNFTVQVIVNQAAHADDADNATHAGSADTATHAGTADSATAASKLGTVAVDETNLAVGKVPVVRNIGGFLKLVYEVPSGSGGSGAVIDDASTNRTDATWSCYFLKSNFDGKANAIHNHDSSYVSLNSDATINGIKTFTSIPVVNGTGTNGYKVQGANGVGLFLAQDGTARSNWYWGTNGGASPVYSNAGESAGKIALSPNADGTVGTLMVSFADGTGKNAGDAIVWTPLWQVGNNICRYKGLDVVHSGNLSSMILALGKADTGTFVISTDTLGSSPTRISRNKTINYLYVDCFDTNGAPQNPTSLTISVYVNGTSVYTSSAITTAAAGMAVNLNLTAGDIVRVVTSNVTGLTGGIAVTPKAVDR